MSGSNYRVSSKEAGQKLRQLLKVHTGLSSKACNALIDRGAVKVDGKTERFGSVSLRVGQVLNWETPLNEPSHKGQRDALADQSSKNSALKNVSAADSSGLDIIHVQNKNININKLNTNINKYNNLSELADDLKDTKISSPQNANICTIVFENDELLVMLKPPGIPSQRTKDPSRINAEDLVAQWAQKNGRGRVILAHRLDRDTSGLLLFGKGEASATLLADWFKHRQIHKTYFALCYGAVEIRRGTWEHFLDQGKMIGGRQSMSIVRSGGVKAVTDYEVLASGRGFSLWKLMPHTGRTHQLRVQLAHAGFPIVGDDLYGNRIGASIETFAIPHHFLHAGELVLPPVAHCPSPMKADLPPAFREAIKIFGWNALV